MAFEKQTVVSAQQIGNIRVLLSDPDPAAPPSSTEQAQQSAIAEIEVLMSDGSARTYRADIAEHFGATTLNQLRTFVESVRTKAIAEIL